MIYLPSIAGQCSGSLGCRTRSHERGASYELRADLRVFTNSPHSRKRKHSLRGRPATYTNNSAKSTFSQGVAKTPHDEAQPEPLALVSPEQSELSEIRSEGCSVDQEPGLDQAVPYVGRTDILGPVPFSERLESSRAIFSAEDSDARYRQWLLDAYCCRTSTPTRPTQRTLSRSTSWTATAHLVDHSGTLHSSSTHSPSCSLSSLLTPPVLTHADGPRPETY